MRGSRELLVLLWVVQWAAVAASGPAFVTRCRAQCSMKLTSDGSKASCLKQEECLRCWASCQAFQRDHYIREYCKLNKACSAGCRQACDFYLSSAGGRDAVSGPAPLTPPTPTSPEARSAPEATPVVVSARPAAPVVIGEHTAEPSSLQTPPASLPSQPRSLQTPPASLPSEPNWKTSSSGLQDHKARWRPHLSDLRPGSPLVSATLTWRSQGRGASYLVTWELRSGGLRGHLVSEEPHVSLSLWPEEDYVVQVFSGEDASEPLLVSTKASPPAEHEDVSIASTSTIAVGAVGLACLAAAAVGCGALICHQRRRRSAEYLLPLEDGREDGGARTRTRTRSLLARNRTVSAVLRPPGKAVAAARLAPLFVISHARR